MILVIDVGNTNITFGVYESKKLVTTFRMTSQTMRTSDEYGTEILAMLQNNQIDRRKVGGAIIASVVPKVMHALIGAVVRYLHTEPLIVGSGIKTGIKITSENPKEIGPDRIVDVVAAYEKYGGPVLVLDFGTATTYDLVTEDGRFGVGITAPGIRISAKALWEDTARLPEVEIKKPDSILARIRALPSPLLTTFGTGQPIFRSKTENGRSSIFLAISLTISGSEPNSCRETGPSSGWICISSSVFLL